MWTHDKYGVTREFLKGVTRGLREEWMEGNLKGNYLRLIPGLNEFIDKFKMAAGNMVSIRGWLWSTHTFQQESKGSWWDLVWIPTGRGKLPGLLEEDRWPFILVDRLFLASPIQMVLHLPLLFSPAITLLTESCQIRYAYSEKLWQQNQVTIQICSQGWVIAYQA